MSEIYWEMCKEINYKYISFPIEARAIYKNEKCCKMLRIYRQRNWYAEIRGITESYRSNISNKDTIVTRCRDVWVLESFETDRRQVWPDKNNFQFLMAVSRIKLSNLVV